MNEIEKRFYDAYKEVTETADYPEDLVNYIKEDLDAQPPIGIYKPDFVLDDFIIEIDGHEYHKTKEQRENDYKRERYFQKKGYKIIRFTGTEVFLNAKECIRELIDITANYWLDREWKDVESFRRGRDYVNPTN